MKNSPANGLRHFSRIAFDSNVSLQLHEQTINAQLIDIALKGALVQTATPQPVVLQEKCRLKLALADGGDRIEMVGRIVHLEDRNIGIECQDIDLASLTQLRRLIELNSDDADLMNRELAGLFSKR